jgi:hypothetical protein
LPNLKKRNKVDPETGKEIFNPYLKPISVSELKKMIAKNNPRNNAGNIFSQDREYVPPETPESLIHRPKFEVSILLSKTYC